MPDFSSSELAGCCFDHEGKTLALSSDVSGSFNIWSIDVATGFCRQLTHSTGGMLHLHSGFRRDGRILFHADYTGQELYRLYLLEPGGEVREVSSLQQARVVAHQWSLDGQTVYCCSDVRNGRDMDVYEVDPDTGKSEMVLENPDHYQIGPISPDEQNIVLSKHSTYLDSDLFTYDRITRQLRHLTPHKGEARHFADSFSFDSKTLYYRTDIDSEFLLVRRLDLHTRRSALVARYTRDVVSCYISPSGRYRFLQVNDEIGTRVYVHDFHERRTRRLPCYGREISSLAISPQESKVAFLASSAGSGSSICVYDLRNKTFRALAGTKQRRIKSSTVRFVRYTSDGLTIPAIWYSPRKTCRNSKGSAVVWLHGGPNQQHKPARNEVIDLFTQNGYIVLAINYRGSTGFGKCFAKEDEVSGPVGQVRDCIAAKQFLTSTGLIAEDRVAIAGHSYGGYLSLLTLALYPHQFCAGVDISGVTNWPRLLQNIPAWGEDLKRLLLRKIGDTATDGGRLQEISPLWQAHRFKDPLLVIQGAEDPIVPRQDSDDLVREVGRCRVEVEYLVCPGEGHQLRTRANRFAAYTTLISFMQRHVAPPSVQD